MKIISRNLLIFAALLFIYTVLFRFGLSSILTAEKYIWILVIVILYSLVTFFTAWSLGKRDGREYFLFDAGLRWNLTTVFICSLVGEGWFLLGFQSAHENIRQIHIQVLVMSAVLLLHLIIFMILRKRTIKGVHKSNIFE